MIITPHTITADQQKHSQTVRAANCWRNIINMRNNSARVVSILVFSREKIEKSCCWFVFKCQCGVVRDHAGQLPPQPSPGQPDMRRRKFGEIFFFPGITGQVYITVARSDNVQWRIMRAGQATVSTLTSVSLFFSATCGSVRPLHSRLIILWDSQWQDPKLHGHNFSFRSTNYFQDLVPVILSFSTYDIRLYLIINT